MKSQYKIILLAIVFVSVQVGLSFAQQLNQTDAQGLKQGKWEKRYSNERVRYEGQFKDDRPFGLFKYYYDTGQLQATNNHVGDGTVANHVYYPNGKIKAKGVFRDQKKDSLWQYFNENEVLVLEESYILDTLHGKQRIYYDNGQLGEETNFDHGVKEGAWLKFFENGKPWVKGRYVRGNVDGKFITYNENGKPKIEGSYILGIKTGVWLTYNENGSIRKQDVYNNGILKTTKYENGEFSSYYDDDIPKNIYNYKGGKREGEFKEFYNKGEWTKDEQPGKMGGPEELIAQLEGTQVKMQGWYHGDKLNGKVTYFNEDGSTQRVEVWEDGTLVSTIDWEKKGNE